MKKIVSILLGAALLCGCGAVAASAANEPAPALYVLTRPSPNMAVAYAYISGGRLFGRVPGYLGSPFQYAFWAWDPDITGVPNPPPTGVAYTGIFPVVENGGIAGMRTVVRTGRYFWTEGRLFEEELNTLIGDTSCDKPAVIYLDENQDVVLQSEHIKRTVRIDPARERFAPSDLSYGEAVAKAGPDARSVNLFSPARFIWGHFWLTLKPFAWGA